MIESRRQPRLRAAPTTSACARRARPYVLFLNRDAEVAPGAVEALAGLLDARPEVGIVGPRTRERRRHAAAFVRPRPHAPFRMAPAAAWCAACAAPRPRGARARSKPWRARARARLGLGVVPAGAARRARGRGRLRRALLPLRGGRGPLRAAAPGRLARAFHARGPGHAPLGRSMERAAGAGAPRVRPQPPAATTANTTARGGQPFSASSWRCKEPPGGSATGNAEGIGPPPAHDSRYRDAGVYQMGDV